jgi:hypothetical protein
MSPADLMVHLRRAGATLEARGGEIHVDAPEGLLTGEILAALLRRRAAILHLLHEEAAAWRRHWATQRLCRGCQRFALGNPEALCFWCRASVVGPAETSGSSCRSNPGSSLDNGEPAPKASPAPGPAR